MMNNINNVQRKTLNYQTPYKLFEKEYGIDICKKLQLKPISKDEVSLGYKIINK